jgi:hypothetical protein
MQIIRSIQSRIYEVRGTRVMLDFDLADLYEVSTKVLNQAVKRNIKRFPEDFMFRLTELEWGAMRSQIVIASKQSKHIIIYQTKRNTAVTPYAFTEQGVAMLSGILNSDRAINMNIAIMRAFELNHIYDALENLLDEKAVQRKWEDRERIGFKK